MNLRRLLWKYQTEKKPILEVRNDKGDLYLARWALIPENKIFNIYLHHIVRSDADRECHDHPWCFLSILLQGTYTEEQDRWCRFKDYKAGDWLFRRGSWTHRLILPKGSVWSLVFTGPEYRTWGFYTENGWVDSHSFRKTT